MLENRRVLIFTGGNLGAWALKEVRPGDFLLGVDKGALFLLRNGCKPEYVVGDFDSVTTEEFAEIKDACKELSCWDPVDKDYTDTELAFSWALNRKPSEILLLGATGTRFDHTLANVHLLSKGLQGGVRCRIIDANNEIMVTDSQLIIEKGPYTYLSLLPLGRSAGGVTLEGFKYPLLNATLNLGESLAISNIQEAATARISVGQGHLLVIRSRD